MAYEREIAFATAANQVPETELDAVRNALNQAQLLCQEVHGIVEKLCGPTPTTEAQGTSKLSSGGILPDLGSRASSASADMDNAIRALQRLDGRL